MDVQLTQKEQMYLQDMLSHEELCITKYANYAEQAQDPQLQQLFREYEQHEKQHYDSITQLLQGQAPSMSSGQQGGQSRQGGQQQWQSMPGSQVSGYSGLTGQSDAQLCQDALTTEKYISGAYDTAIFESANPVVRQTLQHIQQEEQQHGEGIFHYMHARGMYEVQ
ncbi:MAG: spore coat protein [Firmicutes bacterium]|jgi:spore coat protein CotF|nr:spore coat protein [Bacillota bacterium]